MALQFISEKREDNFQEALTEPKWLEWRWVKMEVKFQKPREREAVKYGIPLKTFFIFLVSSFLWNAHICVPQIPI